MAVSAYDSSKERWREEFLDGLGTQYVKVLKRIYAEQDAKVSSAGPGTERGAQRSAVDKAGANDRGHR